MRLYPPISAGSPVRRFLACIRAWTTGFRNQPITAKLTPANTAGPSSHVTHVRYVKERGRRPSPIEGTGGRPALGFKGSGTLARNGLTVK